MTTPTPAEVEELIARLDSAAEWPSSATAWAMLCNEAANTLRRQLALTVPPREPTEDMIKAGVHRWHKLTSAQGFSADAIWRAMYDAAPQQPSAPSMVIKLDDAHPAWVELWACVKAADAMRELAEVHDVDVQTDRDRGAACKTYDAARAALAKEKT
jgi:hypothetical protein